MNKKINSHDDLIELAKTAWGENSSAIVNSIEKRRKWLEIKREFEVLKDKSGLNSKQCIKFLSARHELAISTIEKIVYSK